MLVFSFVGGNQRADFLTVLGSHSPCIMLIHTVAIAPSIVSVVIKFRDNDGDNDFPDSWEAPSSFASFSAFGCMIVKVPQVIVSL